MYTSEYEKTQLWQFFLTEMRRAILNGSRSTVSIKQKLVLDKSYSSLIVVSPVNKLINGYLGRERENITEIHPSYKRSFATGKLQLTTIVVRGL